MGHILILSEVSHSRSEGATGRLGQVDPLSTHSSSMLDVP